MAATSSTKSNKFTNAERKPKGHNFYHQGQKLRTIKMRAERGPIRDRRGRIVKAASFAKSTPDEPVVRVQPDRRWFGNTRVVGQQQLQAFREGVERTQDDPFLVLLRQSKLPLSLLQDSKTGQAGKGLLNVETFEHTFGAKAQRRRPKLAVSSLQELVEQANQREEETPAHQGMDAKEEPSVLLDPAYRKGQSRRIWGELYKVIDSSDVLVHVLDARNPLGTRCPTVERYVARHCPHKHLLFVLNKCDLVPPSITEQWVRHLSHERPTVAFRASVTNPFGKGALIQLLRQYSRLHADKPQISVGLIGYPNVGKSSVINALRKKTVCTVAPVPGQTKVWQYVTLMRRIYLIDCPGIVPPSTTDSATDIVLKGVMRVENIDDAPDHIPRLLELSDNGLVAKTYGLDVGIIQEGAAVFLEALARKAGRLLKGGEPDVSTAARIVLTDWIRGKIPYYTRPPSKPIDDGTRAANCDDTHGDNGDDDKRADHSVSEDKGEANE